jgi:UDP-N-acetylglucosamine 2-epimerase (non-hydrolysing)
MKLTLIVGTRPNFVKMAALIQALEAVREQNVHYRLIHTGQHYDVALSDSLLKDLQIPEPDLNLEIGSDTAAQQTARMMISLEKEFMNHPPDCLLVVGDVNSTLAATLAAKKLLIPVAHVEAGLRSFDMSMPEELNRLLVDVVADYYFTTTSYANENLMNQGVKPEKIFQVGNTMIDTLLRFLDQLRQPTDLTPDLLHNNEYILLTLHRPFNVDDPEKLLDRLRMICKLLPEYKIIFPVHPRCRKHIALVEKASIRNLILTASKPYLEFVYLIKHAAAVITDSGGVQEETTFLHIPCITLRPNTERPETVTLGTNCLAEPIEESLLPLITKLKAGQWKQGQIPELWDGKAAERIVEILLKTFQKQAQLEKDLI